MREAGNYRAAAIKLNAALARQPQNIPARLLAVQIYLDLDRGDAALGLLTRAREDRIDQRQIAELWAQAEFLAQRYQEFSTTPPIFPRSCPVRSGQAFSPIAAGRWGHSAGPPPPSAPSRTGSPRTRIRSMCAFRGSAGD